MDPDSFRRRFPSFGLQQCNEAAAETTKLRPSDNVGSFGFVSIKVSKGLESVSSLRGDGRNRIVSDRLIGFEDLSGKDDFTTRALEHLLKRKGGTIEYLANLVHRNNKHKKKQQQQLQNVELKVRMDYEGLRAQGQEGVKSVDVNLKQQKVTVTGYVEPNKVLKKVQSTGKKAEMWPYVPYNLISQPYAAQVYDKKAPPGYVRNAEVGSINNQGANRRIN
ncbi:hypothetical protein HPP92_004060 [Vanilla planifolia]|uniref:HMA domain-containing protein n=1 Tax=Vanilla planifolia TaxID=51239 RepID=A0A835RW78_VANPL|nr:hypothetical protein HPP92_004060 [Vanilla planifolia]